MHQQRREGRSQRALCARAAAGVPFARPDAVSHSNYRNPSLLIGRAKSVARRRQAWLRDHRHVDARHGHGRADCARPPPSHHRVCKPEAACYAKITEKLCLRNINAVGDLDSTLLPEVVLMLRDCGLWKAPMNSSARSSPPRISSCGSRTLPPQQCSCSAWRQHDGLVRFHQVAPISSAKCRDLARDLALISRY